MENKGFTLVELLAVIVIIGVLAAMVSPAITGVRNNVLDSTLNSKIANINAAALDYANDHIMEVPSGFDTTTIYDECSNNSVCDVYEEADKEGQCIQKHHCKVNNSSCNQYCLLVLVRTLIDKGYLVGDDASKTTVLNPIDNSDMSREVVCVRYDSEDAKKRELVAYILNEYLLTREAKNADLSKCGESTNETNK